MLVTAAFALAMAFGAADQYLGSFSAHPWLADVSLLSAPWLLLAFAAGWTQTDGRRAAVLGFACTFAALIGYGLMTLSPLENAHLTLRSSAGFLRSSRVVFEGGVVTGPLFGWFGSRWRTDRAWLGASLAALAVLLEPAAHYLTGSAIRFRTISLTEMCVGLALVVYVATSAQTRS